MHRRLATVCAAVVATACFSHAASAVTLYNPNIGTTPDAQGWLTRTTGGTVTSTVGGGTYDVSTLADPAISSGSGIQVPFDTAAGFSLSFNLQVLSESHSTADRAGFSVLLVGSNPAEAIELGFWTDHVFVYAYDGASFTHGIDATFDTSTAAHNYLLLVQNQHYTLFSGGTYLLSGDLANYTNFGFPYNVPNSLFLGDDTTRAASSVAIGVVSVNAIPEPSTAGLFLLGGALLAVRKRRPKQ